MKRFFKVLFYIVAALYPILVFTFLVVLKLPVRIVSLCIVALGCTFFLSATGKNRAGVESAKKACASVDVQNARKKMAGIAVRLDWKPIAQSVLLLAAGLFCFFTNQAIFLKLYSVVISATLLIVFGSTLFFPPNIIFRLATLQDKSIRASLAQKNIERYCHKVTIAWCVFFVCNGSVAAVTAFFCSDKTWSLYNGGISYVLMGLMFAVEFIIRKQVDKKMPKVHAICSFTSESRPDNYVLCYEGAWSSGVYKTWRDFLCDTAKVRAFVNSHGSVQSWILHCEDYWYFLCTFVALLQCGKTVMLTQNVTREYLAEIKTDDVAFLTDKKIDGSYFIPDVIENAVMPTEADVRTTPTIVSDDTKILMFTSGSTGKPKAVKQRMTEFELDNAFIISKWGEEFTKRKLVTTVSQHHIYGFLFGISLPFACGVPFRRTRIEYPEEFEKLTDTSYMIIATPAFLKRSVEIEQKLPLDDCFIFTSGGAVSEELAVKTERVFGFCPLEVYGSTETSGIAYRQQTKDGLVWTPFDNAKIWKGDDGCLVIISPYIKDPAGFATADLVDIRDDGRFIMKGRSDSIVKIEEKRISMTEVENRLLQSGLVKETKVIALEDMRQYLAAAVALNDEGKKKFAADKKLTINKFFHEYLAQFFENVVIPKRWRYIDELPSDVQGKVHKEDVAALFAKGDMMCR
ncbi:MAG: AMP-binding protein [Treponema sp.]|nr:AMP-binding protein [Treponema sp.]